VRYSSRPEFESRAAHSKECLCPKGFLSIVSRPDCPLRTIGPVCGKSAGRPRSTAHYRRRVRRARRNRQGDRLSSGLPGEPDGTAFVVRYPLTVVRCSEVRRAPDNGQR
jgi:hypothetical protein